MIEQKEKKRALGRGLESLIPRRPMEQTPSLANTGPDRGTQAAASAGAAEASAAEAAPGERVHEIPLEEIERSPYQPRRKWNEEALKELAASIQEQGVLQPIVVRYISESRKHPHPAEQAAEVPSSELQGAGEGERAPTTVKYQLIAGERRWAASKKAGRATVPAIVRQVSNEQAMEMALIENLQREDLDCLDMAAAFDRLGREFGLTQEQMSLKTGKSRSEIANYLRLLKLPGEVRGRLSLGELTFGHAKELMGIEDPEVMTQAARKVIQDRLSVRGAEELVNHIIWLQSGKLPKKVPKYEDPNVKAARISLEARLGCRVKIADNKGKGKVVIEYKSLEDFDRIVEALGHPDLR
ncbi:MAG: ParB/RepB/Spo0J family partition protein [Terriglobales bacterium]